MKVFFIREEVINIVENVDFLEFAMEFFLFIISMKGNLAINISTAKETMKNIVKQYLKRKSITY